MVKCRICHQEISSDELASHLLSDHPPRERPSKLALAKRELKSVAVVLRRLEKEGLGLADYAAGLGKVANVLGVAVEELESIQREVSALTALSVEYSDIPASELREYLAFMREERAKEAPLHE